MGSINAERNMRQQERGRASHPQVAAKECRASNSSIFSLLCRSLSRGRSAPAVRRKRKKRSRSARTFFVSKKSRKSLLLPVSTVKESGFCRAGTASHGHGVLFFRVRADKNGGRSPQKASSRARSGSPAGACAERAGSAREARPPWCPCPGRTYRARRACRTVRPCRWRGTGRSREGASP